MRVITGKYISRRSVLRGLGVTLALPLLDSMAPAQTSGRKTASAAPSRLACIEMVHGAAGSSAGTTGRHYWSPGQDGADFDFSYCRSGRWDLSLRLGPATGCSGAYPDGTCTRE